MKSRTGITLAVILMATLCLAGGAGAAPSWLCSINNVVGCDEDGTIGTPNLGGLAQPTFLRVDSDRGEIIILAPEERRGEVTKINSVNRGEGLWVFSGVEDERAWSLVISESGYMTLSVTMDGATWSVFGSAMAED